MAKDEGESCLCSHMQEGERGREREREEGEIGYATGMMSLQVKAQAEMTSPGGELAGPKFEGDTPVMSSNSVARRREIFGCRANRRI